MKYLTVVQHTQSEWLGHIEDHLEGRGIRFGYSRPFTTGGKLPDVATIGDGLILLGGGGWGSTPGPAQLPTLDAEVRLARACLMLDKPIFAIGLGAQILSLAADGGVEASPIVLSAGTATRTSDDVLEGYMPAAFPMVVFMRDRPAPPDYAKILAREAAGQPAVFQIGAKAFGFSGHPGVRRAMIEELVMETADAPENSGAVLAEIGGLTPAIEDALVPIMTGLVKAAGWMET